MPIPLESDRQSGPPTLKLREVGDYADLIVFDLEQRDMVDMETRMPKVNPQTGKPRQEQVVFGVVMVASGVITVDDADTVPPVGSLVRVFLSGSRFKAWIDAKNDLRKAESRGVSVGDVARLKFVGTEKSSVRGYQDVKLWSVQLRAAKPSEAALVETAEAAYHARHTPPAVAADVFVDDDPF